MSHTMRQQLSRSNYVFSGLKTFHELNEAFPSLLDENGNRKTFERFLKDVQKIHETYNRNYPVQKKNTAPGTSPQAVSFPIVCGRSPVSRRCIVSMPAFLFLSLRSHTLYAVYVLKQ